MEKGKPFAPGARLRRILEEAARIGNAQMRVQAFADRRPDRAVWPGTQWEWSTLRPENGTFDADSYVDLEAREKWFYQAMVESPAMSATVDLHFGPEAPTVQSPAGSRRCPAKAGSSSFASTVQKNPSSTGRGSYRTSNR
jgi:hypothetical protein